MTATEAGFDHNAKNTAFGPYKWLVAVGSSIQFNVPGFFGIGLHCAQEWNHNGIVGRHQIGERPTVIADHA